MNPKSRYPIERKCGNPATLLLPVGECPGTVTTPDALVEPDAQCPDCGQMYRAVIGDGGFLLRPSG